MQIAILAGGLATRLRPLTEKIPKSMTIIDGKPFLQHQIELLRRNQVTDIVLCVGYLADQIKEYFGDGRRFGVSIKYSEEREKLLRTAGALKNAENLLNDVFFIMYGDSYLLLNYAEIMAYFRKFNSLALMVVYKNFNRYDTSNIAVEGNLVKRFDKKCRTPDMIYIDEGLSVFRREVLDMIPAGQAVSLEEVFPRLIGELLAFETKQRFYEIGSPKGLEEFEQLVASGDAIK